MLPGFGGMIDGGAGGGNVTLNAATISVAGSGSQNCSFRVSNDGFVYYANAGSYVSQYRWTADPVGGYEIRVTLLSGTSPSGSTVGSWLVLSTTRTWTNTDAVSNGVEVFATFTVEIRVAASMAVVATQTVGLIADRTS